MSNGSPTAYLLWAVFSSIFLIFLTIHLWLYDRFNCIRWNSGRQPGAFKRVMTYSYLGTVPLLVIFSIAMATAKYKEGYIVIPYSHEIVPRPLTIWSDRHKRWVLPLNMMLSFAWALELVTHLEELTFWLFLLHQGPGKREWFHSWEFRIWYCGSMIAVLGMPLTAVLARHSIETTQAWIFLTGSSAGTLTTIAFIYVLVRFPEFIQQVKDGGADPDVVVRLATFFNLNRIRVVFRFLFTISLLVIGCDAIMGPYPIIGGPFATDFLLMTGAIGCFVSSAITLLVFFPRSITREEGYRAKAASPQQSDKAPTSPLPEYIQEQPNLTSDHPQHRYVSSYDFDSAAYKAEYPHDYPPASPTSPIGADRPARLQTPHQSYPDPPPTSPSSYFPNQRASSYYPNQLSDLDHGVLGDEEEGSEESSPEYETEIDEDSRLDSPGTVESSYMMRPMQHDPQDPQPLPSPPEVFVHQAESAPPLPQTHQPHLTSESQTSHPLQASNHDRIDTRRSSSRSGVSRPTAGGLSGSAAGVPPFHPAAHTHRGSLATSTGTTLASGHAVQMHPSMPARRRDPSNSQGESWARRRRHSDTPIAYTRNGVAVRATGVLMTAEELLPVVAGSPGPVRAASGRDVTRDSGSSLHPYLINWTSPLDLLDRSTQSSILPGGPHFHPSRMV